MTRSIGSPKKEHYGKKETERRFRAAIQGAFKGSPTPHKEMKLGKPKGKSAKSRGKKNPA
jgi:hypothetical protein